MVIKKASFIISNSDYSKCPTDGRPEYAFIGRSNVGKSSLINMLTNTPGLAKTSGKPGKTQLINHFLINDSWYLVDLPGYGYARSSKGARSQWQKMTADYMLRRQQLSNVFVLVDSRIPPKDIDLQFLSFLGENGIPLCVVFTKIDKEKQREVMRNVSAFKKAMLEEWEELPPIILTSSLTKYGRETLLDYIEKSNELYAQGQQTTTEP